MSAFDNFFAVMIVEFKHNIKFGENKDSNKDISPENLDYVFLSAQPLASIVLYSNDKCQFKCFSINGNELINSNREIKSKLKVNMQD